LPLIYVKERSGRPQLVGRNHEMAPSGQIRMEYVYITRITVSSINLDAQYINSRPRRHEMLFAYERPLCAKTGPSAIGAASIFREAGAC
jgi:hypothetical protein